MKTDKSRIELHDMLLLIASEARTGELVIESGNNIGSLLINQGKILLAFSPYTKAIGDRLVEQGVISEAELLNVLKEQLGRPQVPIGTILQESGKITFPVLEKMVHDQIRSAIKDFASWKPAEFIFMKKTIRPFDGINLPVYEFIPAEMLSAVRLFALSIPEKNKK